MLFSLFFFFSDVSLISVKTAAAALRRGLLSTVTAQGRDTVVLHAITVGTSSTSTIAKANLLSTFNLKESGKHVNRVIPRNQ